MTRELCQGCGQPLQSDDDVIAAKQIRRMSVPGVPADEYIEGRRVFHRAHIDSRWRPVWEGKLKDLPPE